MQMSPFIPAREFFQGPLVHQIHSGSRRSFLVALMLDVAHPKLHGVRVANDLFLIGEISFLLRKIRNPKIVSSPACNATTALLALLAIGGVTKLHGNL